ncbi:2-oxo-4-hydroxy-4-carboxy-5-ureidoimidazoline decarboxylase [Pseudarcicella hirudinis]|uniref:2-oxo-4-hydroxy-4-carboxy-5-ureidoimidazoline decarboxylase n=1 Tax=Pseudarcicella hirudinis TaxID=1079859 RepID=A0A1I5S2V4_9BACT|nr:2-oxo-4-hydroxy-4-carboxy-5-ureidoimidazoline decarboxylase [Pseudarcicella hirudinis]SFP64921.1 2-oxo-4-hydroxy-4-carboxy-5-ureidoimidazoline decarboxylase [Pseudarcicella hirudinis]
MTIEELKKLDQVQLKEALAKCCGSETWQDKMLDVLKKDGKNINSLEDLWNIAGQNWFNCTEKDWLEAFTHHPKIGDIDALKKKFVSTAGWASGEQKGTSDASQEVLESLAEGNEEYEKKFGYIFIVCATGKTAPEMLKLLQDRLPNDPATEIGIAMAEQNKITKLRLEKLLQ